VVLVVIYASMTMLRSFRAGRMELAAARAMAA
jgi:hypothetical protein